MDRVDNRRLRLTFENGASAVLGGTAFEGFRDGSPQQLFGCVPTVRAIDRAGNESEARSVRVC